jgi:hypothetical protein
MGAATVYEYLASLPEDRRAALEAVRNVILRNLDKDYEEGMQYGMIGYYVPHRVYPAGYHCDPSQPLPCICLASQKNHLALYMMGLYMSDKGEIRGYRRWFEEAVKASGRRLDMGKSCIRFKRAEDLPLDVIGEAVRRLPARQYIEMYEKTRAAAKGAGSSVSSKGETRKRGRVTKENKTKKPRVRAKSRAGPKKSGNGRAASGRGRKR